MKLLIIEDSKRLSHSLTVGFTALGFAVDSCLDGREGLSYALSNSYDAIILDLMLPSLDGLTVLRNLRDKKNNTCVLILTAMDEIEERVKGLNLGADDYLCKPFSFDELHARVKTLVRRSHGLGMSTTQIGAISVDFCLRKAVINGEGIPLTPREYSILEYLALNQSRVMTYENLESRLYDERSVVSRNAIEAHVSGLRRKLKSVGVSDLIKTRRGYGYFIE